jgi:type IV pilus assembly protein PilB
MASQYSHASPALLAADDLVELPAESLTLLPHGSRAASNRPLKLGDQHRETRLAGSLIHAGLITKAQVAEAREYQGVYGGRMGSVLVLLGHLTEEQLHGSLARQLGLEICDVESLNPTPEALRLIPEDLVRRYKMIPVDFSGDTLVVGMTDPENTVALDDVRFLLGCDHIEVQLITESTFHRFLSTRFAADAMTAVVAEDHEVEDLDFGLGMDEVESVRFENESQDIGSSPVVKLVNQLLVRAVKLRASDIHVEPYEGFFRVRFRVDGRLYTIVTPPKSYQRPMVSRIKILSGMDIAESRKPQDGHLVMRWNRESLNFRVSTLPTVHGEKCVVRLLKKEAHLADLARLGFHADQLDLVRQNARQTQGLVLVTGPTGSGKTTTLHAMINEINDPDINIVTVEDPVETSIPGVNHVQIQDRGGVTFASGLRSILRQDPDVVFVGEMRDTEVSRIAIRAALTGHLVLSTLHTNGTIESFMRLIDMGVETWLLASSLNLVLAQRLLRRLCPHCATSRSLPQQVVDEYQLDNAQIQRIRYREPTGCRSCLKTGYLGRVAVYECIAPDEDMRAALRKGADETQLIEHAEALGTVWLWQAGVERAVAGETTFAEVGRVLTRRRR